MVSATLDEARAKTSRFYVGMAGVYVLIAFGGFIPTYWAKLLAGTFDGAPILHIHGALFFTWTLFFFAQTSLVAAGRTPDHRMWGMAGISLVTAMAFTVVLAAIHSVPIAEKIGMGDQARQFMVVPLVGLVAFGGFFGTAIANIRRPETHKRLMLLAMIPPMQAAMARLFALVLAPPGAVGPPPVFASVPPGLFVDLLIVAMIVHDRRTRGRVHSVYLIGGPILVAQQLLNVPIGASAAWMSVANWIVSLAG